MSHEIHGKRLAEIKSDLRMCTEYEGIDNEDAEWLIVKLEEAWSMLRSQQNVVNDTASRWRDIGYKDGYSSGYDDAMREMAPDFGFSVGDSPRESEKFLQNGDSVEAAGIEPARTSPQKSAISRDFGGLDSPEGRSDSGESSPGSRCSCGDWPY